MNNKGTELEVVNRDVDAAIDIAKAYAAGLKTSVAHTNGYGALLGGSLNRLKEIVPHGQFEVIASKQFPEFSDRWLRELMSFAKALAVKTELSSVLKNGQLLLELGRDEQEEFFHKVDKTLGSKGLRDFVMDWKKKTAPKPPPMDAVRAEQEHQKNIESAFDTARANLSLLMEFRDVDFVLASKAIRLELKALCVRYGKRVAATKKLKTKTT